MESNITLERRSISETKTHPTFEQLFPIRPEILAKIEEDMEAGNYDLSQPIILATWKGQEEPVCIDGHTRLQASRNAGIETALVWLHEFDTEQEALEKAIRLQQHRRNMTDSEIMVCVAALDSRRIRGGDRRSEAVKSKPSHDGIENSRSQSARNTAELLGISTTKVERTRTVLDNADPETVEEVKQGRKSINKACTETQKKRREAKQQKKGSSLLCVGNTKIELSGYKVNNGYKVSIRAVSPGLRLGRLYETVNAFQYAIGQS